MAFLGVKVQSGVEFVGIFGGKVTLSSGHRTVQVGAWIVGGFMGRSHVTYVVETDGYELRTTSRYTAKCIVSKLLSGDGWLDLVLSMAYSMNDRTFHKFVDNLIKGYIHGEASEELVERELFKKVWLSVVNGRRRDAAKSLAKKILGNVDLFKCKASASRLALKLLRFSRRGGAGKRHDDDPDVGIAKLTAWIS